MKTAIQQVTNKQQAKSKDPVVVNLEELKRNIYALEEEEDGIFENNIPFNLANVPLAQEETAIDTTETKQNTEETLKEGEASSDETQQAEQGTEAATKEEDTTPRSPEEDPNFIALKEKVGTTAEGQSKHISAKKASSKGQAAAKIPEKERSSKAQQKQVGKMEKQEPKKFNAEAFQKQLKDRIAKMQLPKNEEEADDFKNNNNIEEVTKAGTQDATKEKNNASGAIENTTKQEPNTSDIKERSSEKLAATNPGKQPANPEAGTAMPPKRSDTEVSKPLQDNLTSLKDEMAQNEITDELLANNAASEPIIQQAHNDKKELVEHTEAAPAGFRTEEEQVLQASQSSANASGEGTFAKMHGARSGILGQVHKTQEGTGTKDTSERQKVIDHIDGIYETTKQNVTEKLDTLETEVEDKFKVGALIAKVAFEAFVASKMKAYKKERYGDSWYSWKNIKRVGDYVTGLPKEVNQFFVDGRKIYIFIMDIYIKKIATLVADKLNEAQQEITLGKTNIQKYVAGLKPELQKVGQEAADSIQSKFSELESSITDRQNALIDKLAKQYVENLQAIDARIEEMKEANSGLIAKAKKAIAAVIETIKEIRDKIMAFLSDAMEVIGAIIADPIGFLGNLIDGLGQGITNFGKNIVKHMQSGLIAWLTGALGETQITIPDDLFSLSGIFDLVTQILGFTWQRVRDTGAKVIGEPIMKALETGFELVTILKTEGIIGLWNHLKEQFNDLKETVMDGLKDMIITQVIDAGIKWLLSLLNPASAFVKAALAIIDIVKFFIQRAAQIMELVQAFIDGVRAVASGSVSKVAAAIENALAKAIPVVIGFLAALLGLGGLASKVTKFIKKLQGRVEKALISLWKKIKKLAGTFLSKIGIGKKKKGEKGKEKSGGDEKLEDSEVGATMPFNANGTGHQIWVKEVGGSAEIMVKSTPMSVKKRLADWKDRVKGLPEEKQGDAKEFLSNANGQYNEAVELAIKTYEYMDEADDKDATDTEIQKAEGTDEKLENKESALKNSLKKLFNIFGDTEEEALPISQIHYKTISLGGEKFGKQMHAKILTKEGEGGTEPKESNQIYKDLFLRPYTYVRGHLLNHHIQGRGTLENLTPLSIKGNSNHLHTAESSIKKAVQNGAILEYKVSVEYGYIGSISTDDDEIEKAGFTGNEKEVVKKIRVAEQYVATGLTLHADYLKKNKNGEYKKDNSLISNKSVLNPVNFKLSNYKINTQPRQKVSVFDSSIEELSLNTGVSKIGIEKIKEIAEDIGRENLFRYDQLKDETSDFSLKLDINKLNKLDNVILKV